VLDVIIVASDLAEADRAATAVETLAVHHPRRALIILDEPGVGSSRIDATITEVTTAMADGRDSAHEQVFVHVQGPAAEHIPSLVDSFLVPDVATYLWWTGSPPLSAARFLAALEATDVLLLDSARFERPYESFAALAEVADRSIDTVFGDFHWTRLQPWREVIAQFFNPAERRGFLRGIGAVGVDYIAEGRGNRSAAVLLAGWLGSALGWRLKSAAAGRGGVLVANFASPEGHCDRSRWRDSPLVRSPAFVSRPSRRATAAWSLRCATKPTMATSWSRVSSAAGPSRAWSCRCRRRRTMPC
jgi:glucose-6-phosphate dehydrogenase assembly protein OpcA